MPHIDDPRRVGATVRALRESHGWTVTGLANALKISVSHLVNIEAGRKNVTPRLARAIADTLRVPLAAIVTGRDTATITAGKR